MAQLGDHRQITAGPLGRGVRPQPIDLTPVARMWIHATRLGGVTAATLSTRQLLSLEWLT